jgi:hypothetical protein
MRFPLVLRVLDFSIFSKSCQGGPLLIPNFHIVLLRVGRVSVAYGCCHGNQLPYLVRGPYLNLLGPT